MEPDSAYLTARADKALTAQPFEGTPGPWSFQASPAHGYRIRTTASTSNAQWGSGDIAVVFFAGNGRSAAQCKADARLIAAAPKLLAACEAMSAHYSGSLDHQPPYVALARAAIDRATGDAA